MDVEAAAAEEVGDSTPHWLLGLTTSVGTVPTSTERFEKPASPEGKAGILDGDSSHNRSHGRGERKSVVARGGG